MTSMPKMIRSTESFTIFLNVSPSNLLFIIAKEIKPPAKPPIK